MGYERNDRRYGGAGDRGYGGYGADRGRDYGRFPTGGDQDRSRGEPGQARWSGYDDRTTGDRTYGGRDQGSFRDDHDRGFFDRAGDEVRSWFGDEEAERRRQSDERERERDEYRGGSGARGGQDRGYQPTGGRSAGYGAAEGFGYGAGYYGGNQGQGQRGREQGGQQNHDPSYRSWRDRQMDSFDRDYDEYRREHQSRFDSEFKTWREGRQGQRDHLNKVEEHFEVVGSDGSHVGTVDHVRGDQIELTKSDKDAGGKHHYIPSSWIQSVEGNKVTLSKSADQAKQHWRDEARNAGGGDNQRSGLNRSFSGTY